VGPAGELVVQGEDLVRAVLAPAPVAARMTTAATIHIRQSPVTAGTGASGVLGAGAGPPGARRSAGKATRRPGPRETHSCVPLSSGAPGPLALTDQGTPSRTGARSGEGVSGIASFSPGRVARQVRELGATTSRGFHPADAAQRVRRGSSRGGHPMTHTHPFRVAEESSSDTAC
jgi:hypothetical protein